MQLLIFQKASTILPLSETSRARAWDGFEDAPLRLSDGERTRPPTGGSRSGVAGVMVQTGLPEGQETTTVVRILHRLQANRSRREV
jgi:hypothetical protein